MVIIEFIKIGLKDVVKWKFSDLKGLNFFLFSILMRLDEVK